MGYDFSKVGGAKISNRGQRLEPGDYVVEIKKCDAFEARDKTNYFVSDYTVIESTNEKCPPGVERNWMQDMDCDAGPGALKEFMVAALGYDHKDGAHQLVIKEKLEPNMAALCAEALDDPKDAACKNALKGKKVRVHVEIIITKEKKQEFSKHTWAPYKEPANKAEAPAAK